MGRLILDTSVLIALERGNVTIEEIIGPDDEVSIAAVTIAEMVNGIDGGASSKQATRKRDFEQLLEAVTVQVYDETVARAHAELLIHSRRAGRPRGAHDLIIAATARTAGATVVTYDRTGFDDLPGVAVKRS